MVAEFFENRFEENTSVFVMAIRYFPNELLVRWFKHDIWILNFVITKTLN